MSERIMIGMALAAVPVYVVSGLGLTVCRLWLQEHDEAPMGPAWQVGVACATARAAAVAALAAACVGLVLP